MYMARFCPCDPNGCGRIRRLSSVPTPLPPPVLADALVIDAHVHGPRLLPQPFRTLYRLLNVRTMPAAVGLDRLGAAKVDAVVCKAVGDPVVTRLYTGDPWRAVVTQLHRLGGEIRRAGCRHVRDHHELLSARAAGQPAVLLGLEGADAIGRRLDRLDELHRLGVRMVVPVHLGDNQIGTTALPWQGYVGAIPARRSRPPGLTAFGRDAVARMDELGILVDVSHADEDTTLGIVDASRRPVVASHSGARACQDFARYLSDEAAVAVAGTGGVIGLWPYFHRGRGAANLDGLLAQVAHLARLVGPEHLCIGTDMNGVPGLMAGYRGEADLPVITAGLLRIGLDEADVRGIMGENFLRVLKAVVA
jgi:membrane dipeptidase